ncbi:MAG: NAD-dependent epimerase/dehydratase family protein [Bacteroidetes bacterium]|nr:NAD-dependent epimerase/dehydratase family protein [Bacteroidota bacterium]
MSERILILGSSGQIGTDLVQFLRTKYGNENVVAADLKAQPILIGCEGPFEFIDVLDGQKVFDTIKKYKITQVYLLAALLSATAEQKVKSAWRLNMEGLFNILDIAKENPALKIFWPSSIAVFGPTTPRIQTPQYTIMEPSTVYGISKLAGERWCEYYNAKYNVDVRSLRYPGLISYKTDPGGGTTDYAVAIYHEALNKKSYNCYLREDTRLPMMYMPDAIRATTSLMEAESSRIKIRSAYNLSAVDFTPTEIASSIRAHIPEFEMTCVPDSRQAIADSWPQSIDDSSAREHWGWKHDYDLDKMTEDMLMHLKVVSNKAL